MTPVRMLLVSAFLVACGNASSGNATSGGPDATAEGSGNTLAADTGGGVNGNSKQDAPGSSGSDARSGQDGGAEARGDANTASDGGTGADTVTSGDANAAFDGDAGADAITSGSDAATVGCNGGPSWPADAALPPPVHICAFANDGGNVFPLFDKCCVADNDCAFGVYMYSCCGDTLALGFNQSQTTAFDAKNAQWNCAACGCAGAGLHTEDGQQAVVDAGVRCDNGFCETFAR